MVGVFFTNESNAFRKGLLLTLPQNLGLFLGAMLLSFFGTAIGHWRWTLTGSVAIMVVFGALLALGTPEREGMMIAFIFLAEIGFGWAQYLSIAFIQFGVEQEELGISGGLAGVARFAGGSVAISVYTTILTNVQSTQAAKLIPAAATAAGLPSSSVAELLKALPLGSAALAKVPGITTEIMAAAGAAFLQSYVVGLRTTALSSLSFGVLGIIACICTKDIGPKMNDKIEVSYSRFLAHISKRSLTVCSRSISRMTRTLTRTNITERFNKLRCLYYLDQGIFGSELYFLWYNVSDIPSRYLSNGSARTSYEEQGRFRCVCDLANLEFP